MKKTYFDSSAVVKLYVPEAHSIKVSAFVRSLQHPILFSHLHDLEIRNGLRLKVFRGESAANAVDAALRLMDEDLRSGVLVRPDLNWLDVFRHAERPSKELSSVMGAQSLDLLHIASALILQAEDFLTFDNRQRAAAKKAGLKIAAP